MRILLCTNPSASEIDRLVSSLVRAGADSIRYAWDLPSATQGASEDIDLLISDRFQFIFPESFLRNINPVAINTHMSLLPRHRGTQALFFCTLLGDRHGWSIHKIDSGIDTGRVVLQERINYSDDESFRELHRRTRAEIIKGLCKLVSSAPDWFDQTSYAAQPVFAGKAHRRAVFESLFANLPLGWDTTIKEARFLLRDFLASQCSEHVPSTLSARTDSSSLTVRK